MDAQRLTHRIDGTITLLADSFEGKRLTGPNDVVVKSDNSIWFSDNGAGSRGNYLGHTVKQELPFRVYRLDPASGQMTIVVDQAQQKRPNGLAFSPDEKLLYVIDTPGALGPRAIYVYDVVDNGAKTANGRVFNTAEPGGSDGFRVDIQGNLWCGWSGGEAEDGVAIFAPDGKMIGRIMLPERCTNVCFGGKKRNRLFMAAGQSVTPSTSLPGLLCRRKSERIPPVWWVAPGSGMPGSRRDGSLCFRLRGPPPGCGGAKTGVRHRVGDAGAR